MRLRMQARKLQRDMNLERENVPYLVFVLVLSVLAVVALTISSFGKPSADTQKILEYADVVVCVLFFIDFLVTLFVQRVVGDILSPGVGSI